MSELRERINGLFAECKAEYGPVPRERGKVAPDEYTDAVFLAVREALLNDEEIAYAALDAERAWGRGGQCTTRMHPVSRAMVMIEAALDAAGVRGDGDARVSPGLP